jgi:acetyl esterase/lipase
MIKALYIFGFTLLFLGLIYHFAALKAFNFLVPKDAGSEFAVGSVPYGSEPRQLLDIYRPKQAAANLPVLIFVHGGSWKDGDGKDYEFVGRAFAAQGYLTFVISYRLLPEHVYPAFVQDVANAVAWANMHANEYGGDGKRIYLVGHSAGGYNIAMATLDQHYMRDAGANPASLKAIAAIAAPLDFLPLDTPISIATFSQVANLESTQPITFARVDAPPFLMLQGAVDDTVMPKNSINMEKRLTELGARAKLIVYDDVTHVGIMLALSKPLRGKVPTLADVVRFFKDNSQ